MISKIAYLAIIANAKEYYNILSLDSAQYKGLITANFVAHMEDVAYELAMEGQCLPAERKSKKISMVELFDMIAGSETGSIVATTIALKNVEEAEADGEDDKEETEKEDRPNRFFADTAVQFFEQTVDVLYYESRIPVALQVFIWVLLLGIFGRLSFWYAEKQFIKEGYEDSLDFLGDYIRIRKDKILGKPQDKSELEKHEYYTSCVDDHDNLKRIMLEVRKIVPVAELQEDHPALSDKEAVHKMELLLQQEDKYKRIQASYHQ